MLLLAAADAFKGDYKNAVNQALGIEMFHNFTLLHDDVMDNADIRRGAPTVHKKWNEATAILSGDAMLTLATILMSKCSSSVQSRVLDFFNKTAMEIYEGQQYDMDFESRMDVSESEYMEMIRLKTSVLLGASCYIGSLIALDSVGSLDDVHLSKAVALRDYAEFVGLAFQLRDDYLDSFGDPATFGKEIGGDILNNKKTWLLTVALSLDKDGYLKDIVSTGKYDNTPERKIEIVKDFYVKHGIPDACAAKINELIDSAISRLDDAGLDDDAYTFFRNIALSSATRTN